MLGINDQRCKGRGNAGIEVSAGFFLLARRRFVQRFSRTPCLAKPGTTVLR